MVPGETPHNSKSPDEPVTIDLEAERIDTTTATSDTSDTTPQDSVGSTSDAVNEPADPATPEADPEEPVAAQAAQPEKAAAPLAAKPATSSSGAIAAGIFGGLVALLGAGSIQYAGFLPNLGPAEKPATVAVDYSADISALNTKLSELSMKPVAAPDLSAIEGRIAALETSVSALSSAPQPSGSSAANDAAVKAMGDKLAALELDLATAKSGLADAQQKLQAPKNEINVGKAIATSALKAAIDRGGPFVSELETLANVAPDDPVIAKLQPFAKAGVLSRAQLAKQMPSVADTILTTVNQPAPGTGLTERLVQSALSIVKVRPVGDVEGEGPEAIVARMEERLQNGDLKGSAEQWDTLPDAGKAASKDFKAALDNRIAVESLIGSAMTDAVSGSATKG